MRQPLLLGNWKMNLVPDDAAALARAVAECSAPGVDVGVAPASALLSAVRSAAPTLWVYAQDVSAHASGAYTGEVSAAMLRGLGVRGALVGHSERRTYHGESDAEVASKVGQLQACGLEAVVCVGETLEQRDAGVTLEVVTAQLVDGLAGATASGLTIAYEPVWAIGTGRTASPAQAGAVHDAIRAWLTARFGGLAESVRVLYGGSMKPENAGELLAERSIDGGLVGGASLSADAFGAMIATASRGG